MLVVGAVALVLLVAGGDDPGTAGLAAGSTPTLPSDFPESAGAEPTGTEPPVITAAPAPTVVARPDVPEAARTIAGATAPFTESAGWSDGISLRVADAVQQVSAGQGPGALAGQPQTVFVLELSNGSDAPLDVNGVVVQAVYGSAGVQAGPLYDDRTVDFGGTLAPGETAQAVYSFAVPADRTGDVTLSVDVDGYRFPAIFTGSVPVG